MGLVLRDGSFLKERPFQPPWTSHSLLVPSTWAEPGLKALFSPRRVRADLLLADLDVLQPVMLRAYGGWDSAAARGWNWDQWFANWRGQLAVKGNQEITVDEAFAPIDQLLAFQRDNHTQIPLARHTSDGSQTAVLARIPAASCTEVRAGGHVLLIDSHDAGQNIRRAKLWSPGSHAFVDTSYIALPRSRGVPQAVHCGDQWIAVQPDGGRSGGVSSLLGAVWTEVLHHPHPIIQRIGSGVVYARLPTFSSANYLGVSRKGWPARQPSDRILIVDLRGNEGSSADYGIDVLKGWIDPDRMVPFSSIGSRIDASCLYLPLRWNYPDLVDTDARQRLLDQMAQPFPPGCPRSVTASPSKWTYLQHRFAPTPSEMRIIALVDSSCGSDCELMTEKLASLPETLVVGVNTFGVCQMIQPGYSVLPHTGLRYRIALGRSDPYGDNRSVDGYGLDVDVVVPSVESLGPDDLRQLASIVARL
ncbi:MAG TPA: S41 family peptidase [Acidobacteriaceae bacterium]|nr:S41 family peptidase [Acidobacteriaceae bacterium]